MSRARNPRRVLLGKLRGMNKIARSLTSLWDVAGKTWDPSLAVDEPGRRTSGGWRTKRPDELPENDSTNWAITCDKLDRLICEATEARAFAYAQYRAVSRKEEAKP